MRARGRCRRESSFEVVSEGGRKGGGRGDPVMRTVLRVSEKAIVVAKAWEFRSEELTMLRSLRTSN